MHTFYIFFVGVKHFKNISLNYSNTNLKVLYNKWFISGFWEKLYKIHSDRKVITKFAVKMLYT